MTNSDAAKRIRKYLEFSGPTFSKMSEAMTAAAKALDEDGRVCMHRMAGDGEWYDTGCGHVLVLDDGLLEDNPSIRFCQFCGGKLEVVNG